MPSALVLGASGQLGIAVTEELLAAGWHVRTVTRAGRLPPSHIRARGVSVIDSAGRSPDGILRDLGCTVDAIFDPTVYDARDAETLLQALPRAGHLVVVSTASVYADADGRSLETAHLRGFPDFPVPIPEDAPCLPPGPDSYSRAKVAMEARLLAADAPVAMLRAGAVHGRHALHPREWWLVKRALDDRPAVPVAYDGASRFQTTGARGLARLALRCIETGATGPINAADADAPGVVAIAAAVAAIIGRPIPVAPFSGPPIGPVGNSPWSTAGPMVLDLTRARGLGWTPPTYAEQVGELCGWLLETAAQGDWRERFPVMAGYGFDPFDYACEDAFLDGRDRGGGDRGDGDRGARDGGGRDASARRPAASR